MNVQLTVKLTDNELKWRAQDIRDRVFLKLAKEVSLQSDDPSTKVGAVIVDGDHKVVSTGFNRLPARTALVWADRDEKIARVVHAEMDAIMRAERPVVGCTLYVWPPALAPSCDRCTAHIIHAGIARVVGQLPAPGDSFSERWRTSLERSLAMYREAGVRVRLVPHE
jgi:dCMP deaminase